MTGGNETVASNSNSNNNNNNDTESARANDPSPDRRPQLTDQTNYLPTRQIITVFAGCAMAISLSFLDQTTVSTALSSITSEFNGGDVSSWVATSYLMTSTCFQPLYGRFSDIFGRKVVLITALSIFFLGSLASSLSQTIIQLIVFRAFSGVGGGGLITLGQVIISDVVSLRDRGKYQGIIGSVIAIANGVGPLIGGALAEKDWRWIFRLNLPLTVMAIAVAYFVLPLKHVEGSYKKKLKLIDYLGTFLILASNILILMALHWGGLEKPWSSGQILSPLIVGLFLGVVFSFWEWRGAKLPILPMYLFKNRTACGVLITTFVNGYVFFTQLFYLPQFYEVIFEKSPTMSGVLLLPLVITQTITSTLAGWYTSKVGRYVENIWIGWAVWAVGIGLLSTLTENSSIGKLIGYLILTGAGAGQTLQIALIALQASVARKEMAVATSARNFMRNFGGTVALAISSSVINNVFDSSAANNENISQSIISSVIRDPTSINHRTDVTDDQRIALKSSYQKAFQTLFWINAGLTAFTFIIAILTIRHHELNRKDDSELKAKSKQWLSQRGDKVQKKTKLPPSPRSSVHEQDSDTQNISLQTMNRSNGNGNDNNNNLFSNKQNDSNV